MFLRSCSTRFIGSKCAYTITPAVVGRSLRPHGDREGACRVDLIRVACLSSQPHSHVGGGWSTLLQLSSELVSAVTQAEYIWNRCYYAIDFKKGRPLDDDMLRVAVGK